MYEQLLKLDELFGDGGGVDGLDEDIRKKLHKIFMARWDYFHKPIFTAAYYLDPKNIHQKLSSSANADLNTVFRQMATEEHDIGSIMADYGMMKTALQADTHGMDEREVKLTLA